MFLFLTGDQRWKLFLDISHHLSGQSTSGVVYILWDPPIKLVCTWGRLLAHVLPFCVFLSIVSKPLFLIRFCSVCFQRLDGQFWVLPSWGIKKLIKIMKSYLTTVHPPVVSHRIWKYVVYVCIHFQDELEMDGDSCTVYPMYWIWLMNMSRSLTVVWWEIMKHESHNLWWKQGRGNA